MMKASNARVVRITRAIGRRKIEMLALATIAAISALGIARQDGPAAEVATVTRKVATSAISSVTAASAVAPIPGSSDTYGASNGRAKRADLAMLNNPRVDSWIRRFTTDLRGSMATYLDRMTRYERLITGQLDQHGMPQSLIYLAMIESGFNPTARSRVSAAGLWQFMTATARQMGLRVNGRVDERTNPARSTQAAVKYLSYLYDRFGSWYLAAAAYNGGEGTVARALKRVTGRTRGSDADFYRISPRLPQETRDYVPKLIAAARIGKNPARYGFTGN